MDDRQSRATTGSESGAVLVFTMIGLVVMLGMAALVIDLGYGYVMDRKAGNAADHAALAAAFAGCSGNDATAAAQTSIVNNGFEVGQLTLTTPATDSYQAVVTTQADTFFASIMGFDTITVSAGAIANCSANSGGSYAIFAGGNTCDSFGKLELDISGSDQELFGGVHSNGTVNVGGSSNDFGPGDPAEDPFTWVTSFNDGGSGNGYDAGYPNQVAYISTWPVEFDRAYYEALAQDGSPDHHYVVGDIDESYIQSNGDGLYYATGKIILGATVNLDLTLVAEDLIDISASNQTLNPFVDELLIFGAIQYTGIDQCDKQGIKMAGSSNNWNGYIYAPWSQVEFSGSSNTAVLGSIVSHSVKLNGSVVNVTAAGGSGSGVPDVWLEQ